MIDHFLVLEKDLVCSPGQTAWPNWISNYSDKYEEHFDLVYKCLYMFPCTSEVCNNLSCFLKIVVKLVELQSFMYTLSPWFGLWGAYFNLRCKYLDNKKTCPKSGGSLLGENTLCYTGFNQSQQEEAKHHLDVLLFLPH